jgi:hypothetical protein
VRCGTGRERRSCGSTAPETTEAAAARWRSTSSRGTARSSTTAWSRVGGEPAADLAPHRLLLQSGAREAALGFSAAELAPLFRRAHLTVDEQRELLRGRPIGAVRVSVGIVTTPDDVARLVELLRGFADRPAGRSPARLRRSLRHGPARAGRGAGLARPR